MLAGAMMVSVPDGQVSFKFAAGVTSSRSQQSSTWLVRVTRGPEVFVTNRDAGGRLDIGHVSFHRDGRCHAKFRTVPGSTSRAGLKKVREWQVPSPLPGTQLVRLLDIHIPHRGLVSPAALVRADKDTVLVPPPNPGDQLAVVLFLEPGTADQTTWPGKRAMGTTLVARATLFSQLDEPVLSVTAVANYSPESRTAIQVSEATVTTREGLPHPPDLRALLFGTEDLDGVTVPILTEMPVGHMASHG